MTSVPSPSPDDVTRDAAVSRAHAAHRRRARVAADFGNLKSLHGLGDGVGGVGARGVRLDARGAQAFDFFNADAFEFGSFHGRVSPFCFTTCVCELFHKKAPPG